MEFEPITIVDLPESLTAERGGGIGVLRINREHKRNALDEETITGIEAFMRSLPSDVNAVVLDAVGETFCAGIDLTSLGERDVESGLAYSRAVHRAFDAVEQAPVPVIAALKGAVIGAGLELASSTHIRVADTSAFFALPEGQHGIFVGGGGSVRVPKLIGTSRTLDMMLTGRVYRGADANSAGFAQYWVQAGDAFATAIKLAAKVSGNAPMSTFAILQALPLIAQAHPREGLLLESLMAAVAQSSTEAKSRMAAFLDGRARRVGEDREGH
jgi:enoyl-CoA hydratase/carnithine racemase